MKTENVAIFAPDTLTVAGVEFPVTYTRTEEAITAAVELDGKPYLLTIPAGHELHAAALTACEGGTAPVDEAAAVELCGNVEPAAEEQPAPVEAVEDPAPVEDPDPIEELRKYDPAKAAKWARIRANVDAINAAREEQPTAEAEEQPAPVEDPDPVEQPAPIPAAKAAHGPVPDKFFIGQTLRGKGWKIDFDAGYDRTRVIFQRKPCKAAMDAVKAAGFYWSPSMKSWNKGLNWKAFRAAQKLEQELKRICG